MVGLTTGEWIELAVAIGTIALAAAAFTQMFAEVRSRPDLTLELDTDDIQTRLEGPGMPWIRLMVRNRKRRRAATGTRVLVDQYREKASRASPVSLAGPELGWPSTHLAEGEGPVVFGGTARPLDFGALGAGRIDGPRGNVMSLMQTPETLPDGYWWWFRFTLAMHARRQFIGREFLPPKGGGYTTRLTVGADEGKARTFDVEFDWIGDAPTAEAALGSLLMSVNPAEETLRRRLLSPRFVRRALR